MTHPKAPPKNPIALFARYFAQAQKQDGMDATAAALATSDAHGKVSLRMILLKQMDERGFVFYTNLASRKARDIAHNPQAALCCYWHPLNVQIRMEGVVSPVDDREADAYFASRHRLSQLGAWASKQSAPLDSQATLERRLQQLQKKFHGRDVPRPDHWSGFRLAPLSMEFWHRRDGRLHERLLFWRDDVSHTQWQHTHLYP